MMVNNKKAFEDSWYMIMESKYGYYAKVVYVKRNWFTGKVKYKIKMLTRGVLDVITCDKIDELESLICDHYIKQNRLIMYSGPGTPAVVRIGRMTK